MSLKAYEDACLRAELFGQPLPNKDDFLEQHKHLDVVEFEEVDIKNAAENTAMLNDDINATNGGFNELNTILSSTQTKLNKLKGVCGSLTNFFRVKLAAKDNLSYSSEPSYVGQTNYDKDYVLPTSQGNIEHDSKDKTEFLTDGEMSVRAGSSKIKQNGGDINSALLDLEAMQSNENTSVVTVSAMKDVGKQISSQVSKLDQIIMKADKAQESLSSQNKQMRSFLR